mmetsp:Transcript_63166/g.110034  ORF Transcript_63166/g.110034 Transcript_63166/m.110034 type:complete len:504 (+) Transcript_63166:90-1601(+)
MAPKAKADAKKAAAKKQPKEKKAEEEEPQKPKVEAPNQEKHQEALQKIQEAIDKIQKEAAGFTAQIKERSGGKEDFFSKKTEIKAELDAVSEKIGALMTRKQEIQGAIGNKREEQSAMRNDLIKMKKSMTYQSEGAIDERIASIEFKLWTDSLSLKEEKKCLAEIQELKKSKPKVGQVGQMENKLKDFNSTLSLKEQNKEIVAEVSKLRDEKTKISERYKALQEERQQQLGDLPKIIEQRDELQKQIRAKIEERNELRDKFQAEKKAFQAYQAELREARRAKEQAARAAYQEEKRRDQLKREVEKMDEQPHLDEITLIEQTIKFCKGLLPQDATEKKEDKKETVFNNKDNETVLMKKEDRDEEYFFAPTKKGKSAKKSKSAGSSDGAKPIKHNAETFQLFDKLKLDAPMTTNDIPKLLEALDAQMEDYQAKVKKWEEEKEEKKRLILEGGILPSEQKEEEAEEEKAEEKEEEEAEKEEEKEEEEEEKVEEKEEEEAKEEEKED